MNDVTSKFNKVIARFENLSRETYDRLQKTMVAIGIDLVSHIRRDYLSGQVLNSRSGMLKRSISAKTTQNGITFTTTIGVFPESRVPYARLHEDGGTINMPAYVGRLMRFHAAGTGDLVFTHNRRAYTIRMPARPYVRPAVEESVEFIRSRLQGAVVNTEV